MKYAELQLQALYLETIRDRERMFFYGPEKMSFQSEDVESFCSPNVTGELVPTQTVVILLSGIWALL